MVRNKAKDFGKTAEIRGPKAQSEAVRSDGSINSEPQERLKENRRTPPRRAPAWLIILPKR